MDANGQRVWMLAGERAWDLGVDTPATVRWDRSRRTLRLAGRRVLPDPVGVPDPAGDAEDRLDRPRAALDAFGGLAFWHAGSGTVRATHPGIPGDVPLFEPEGAPADLCVGHDGVLYIAADGKVALRDLRERWDAAPLAHPDLTPWRLAPRAGGGVWVLDRVHRRLGRVRGLPLPHRPAPDLDPGTWRPDPEDPDPPRLGRVLDLEIGEEEAVALASSPAGRLALLTWKPGGAAILRLLREEDGRFRFGTPLALRRGDDTPLSFPWSLAWLSGDRIAVLVSGLEQAPAYDIPEADDGDRLEPAGDFYPLRDHDGGPFLNGPAPLPHYPAGPGKSRALHRLSLPAFPASGRAASAAPVDSGRSGTEWHRLYLEAALPPGCGISIRLRAGDDRDAPPEDAYEHLFGHVPGAAPGAPRGAWVPFPSESPFHPGLLPCVPEPGRTGLFTALVQRAGRRVTSLTGRYLWVEIELLGDGRTTPEVAALRTWGSRFSYADHYLPELYREDALGAEGDDEAPATPADFLERFLGNFEGILTPLEDRIAAAHLLTDPGTVPADALEWLGSWIGVTFEPGMSEERRRTLLRAAPELYRWRGTLRGLRAALDVATGGAVVGGEIVVLEDWRLRRTFVTILGADLSDEADPLLGGLTVSGNSIVGDTLFLGEENRREFLALFGADLPASPAERQAIQLFFERLAHRVTILVHQRVEPQDLGLIRRVARAEAPAHVEVRVLTASVPFLVGAASLVGVDTYLAPEPAARPVEVGRSQLGLRDFLLGLSTLDPRLGGGDPLDDSPPVATAEASQQAVGYQKAFVLDGSRSHAFGGRRIVRYHWTLKTL